MRKTPIIISSILGAIVFIILLIYIFTSTILGSILTSAFGTKTTVNNTVISPFHLRFWQLHVLNPPNARHPYALSIKRISVGAPITTYFTNDIHIKEIELVGLTLVVETLPGQGKVTNWDAIIAHINKTEVKNPNSKRHTTIDSLIIKKLTIKIVDPSGKVSITKIKELKFSDLSTRHGDITSQIAKTIVMKLIFNVNTIIKIPVKLTKESMNNFMKNARFGPSTRSPSKALGH